MRRVIFFGILIFAFSIGIGYYYSALWKNGGSNIAYENTNNREEIEETVSQEEKISYDATFALKKYYTTCGHFNFQYSELPKEMINLSRKDIEKNYPEWEIEEFSSKNLVLSQKIDNMCDEHYVLKFGDNDNIAVYHLTETGEEELYKNTNISKEYLTSADIENLEAGIYVYGIENLNSAIEDFE